MKGFYIKLQEFMEASGNGTHKQREQNLEDYIKNHVDKFKRLDHRPNGEGHRISVYLIKKNGDIHIGTHRWARPPSYISPENWLAYEAAMTIENAETFKNKEEAKKWVHAEEENKTKYWNPLWETNSDHMKFETRDIIQEIENL